MSGINLKALSQAELAACFAQLGLEPYRARQVFAWVWQKGVNDFGAMTNLGRALRRRLADTFALPALTVVATRQASDGTVKLGLRLPDQLLVETVFIPDRQRRTVCVSTQVGCRLGCAICRTARVRFVRDLAAWEIADQARQVATRTGVRLTNLVFMGMGEPLLNYDAVLAAARLANDDLGLGIGARRITISTAGIVPGIIRLADEPEQFKLAVSLNASDDRTRARLMPVTCAHPLADLIAAVRTYVERKRKRVTFEYVLVRGVNDREEDARRLERLLAGIPCKINLIPLNPFPGCRLEAPAAGAVEAFARRLYPRLPAVTIRRSRGQDVLAACGQLAGDSARRPGTAPG